MDHDQRFKVLIREFFREFIALFFAAWLENFDFGRIEWLDKEVFFDPPTGEKRVADLVAKLPLRRPVRLQSDAPEVWHLLVNVEIDSREDSTVLPKQCFEYYRQLRTRHGLPVLPVGVFLRVGLRGTGRLTYEEAIWGSRINLFELDYVGLPALAALVYLESGNVLGVALTALMRVPDDRRAWLKAEAQQRIARSQESDYRKYLLNDCVEAYLVLEGPQQAEYEGLLKTEPYKEAQAMAVTSYEKGLTKGREEGREEGQRYLLEQLLSQRFGPLPAFVLERLAALPAERLSAIGKALLTANSLQELGLQD